MTIAIKNSAFSVFSLILMFVGLVVTQLPQSSSVSADEKMTAQQVIARHIEAVGQKESRESIKTRVLSGSCKFIVRNGSGGELQGPAVLASDGKKMLVGINFGNTAYPAEQFGYDGQKLTTGYITPGRRSALGDFLLSENVILREGLLGGVLSSAWPLFDEALNSNLVEYGGLKKIGGRQSHEIRYSPKRGSDSQIKLFFDAENFNHIRSEYKRLISAQMRSNPESSTTNQRETRYSLTEDFGEFKKEAGLMLPHSYKIQLSVEGTGSTYLSEWSLNFNRFQFNQKIPAESFTIATAASQEK